MLRLCTQGVVHMYKGSLHLFKALHLSAHIAAVRLQGLAYDSFVDMPC